MTKKPSKFQPGDVVSCYFPHEEDPNTTDWRPALVVDSYYVANQPFYRLVKITKTNNSHKYSGKWILARSEEGRLMRLTYDSFIHFGRIADVPDYGNGNVRYRGRCSSKLWTEISECFK